jgi:hypothetical protein
MRSTLALSALLLSSTAACVADPGSDAEVSGEESAVVEARTRCSLYKKAVDGAMARRRGQRCEDGTSLYEITSALHASVSACGQFRTVIATSPWAKPVRDELAGNMMLPVLTDRVKLKEESGRQLVTTMDATLAGGITVYGPAPGAYGNMSKLTFAADGKVVLARLDISDEGAASWRETGGTYQTTGSSVKVTVSGEETVYEVRFEVHEGGGSSVPEVVFVSGEPGAGTKFRSLPSECEA